MFLCAAFEALTAVTREYGLLGCNASLPFASAGFLRGLFFNLKDGGDMFL
jgi:hypothetical protein